MSVKQFVEQLYYNRRFTPAVAMGSLDKGGATIVVSSSRRELTIGTAPRRDRKVTCRLVHGVEPTPGDEQMRDRTGQSLKLRR